MSRAEVFLHPLVLVNIADHYTRMKVSAPAAGGPPVRALGAFMGIQEGTSVSILDSMEMNVDPANLDINKSLVTRKLALTHAVFPRFELLGWYLSGPLLLDQEMLIVHKQMQDFNESPLVMVMGNVEEIGMNNGNRSKDKKVLPVAVYETVMQMVNDQPVQTFVEVPVNIETTESERATVDHVVTQKSGNAGETSTLNAHMASLKNAVEMLRGRILVLRKFLEMSKSGQLPVDHALLREADAVCNQLPVLDPDMLRVDLNSQLADALLVSLLSAMTKETASVSSILEKFYTAFPNPGEADKANEKSKSKRGSASRRM